MFIIAYSFHTQIGNVCCLHLWTGSGLLIRWLLKVRLSFVCMHVEATYYISELTKGNLSLDLLNRNLEKSTSWWEVQRFLTSSRCTWGATCFTKGNLHYNIPITWRLENCVNVFNRNHGVVGNLFYVIHVNFFKKWAFNCVTFWTWFSWRWVTATLDLSMWNQQIADLISKAISSRKSVGASKARKQCPF